MTTPTANDAPYEEDGFITYFKRYYLEPLPLAALFGIVTLIATIPYLNIVTELSLFATGFTQLLPVQMALILFWVLSATVIESVWGGRFFDWVAHMLPVDSQAKIIYVTGFIALLFGWINWALGFIGAIFIGYRLCLYAKESGVRVHYPAVLTAGLLALVTMNQGMSSPGALLMADTTGMTNFLVNPNQGQIVLNLRTFIFNPVNLISSALFIVTLPALLVVLAPNDENERRDVSEFPSILDGTITETLRHHSPPPRAEWKVADRLEQSPIFSAVAFLVGAVSIAAYFITGGKLTMLWFLFLLIILGLIVQVLPMAFVEKTRDATKWANHLVIPFFFYASVYTLLTEANLYTPIGNILASTGMTQVSSYVVAFVLGLVVPDPGSVWVIQGPALVAANSNLALSMVSVMYGAGISNLWLSFLFVGIIAPMSGFNWRQYVKYMAVVTVYTSVIIIVLLLIF